MSESFSKIQIHAVFEISVSQQDHNEDKDMEDV
jgi:hypothetical protein